MKMSFLMGSALALGLAFAMPHALQAEGGHGGWSYEGSTGPDHWGALDPAYELCASGKNQTPVDMTGFVEADLSPIDFKYGTPATDIVNNGHTVQINMTPGSAITIAGRTFNLIQMHFHTPSENHINGKSFAMEGHMVHADADGNLAVIAILYEEGDANARLAPFWADLPPKAGDTRPAPSGVPASSLLGDNPDYYRFNGSLTTPPCSEGVWWLVLKEPQSVSAGQVAAFMATQPGPNNRTIQNVFARPILR
ncbi:carbonic anhydrase [Thalassospira sp.]|uniref:carbonic anhydrase n=1 Tax=Thalassospira sp. TaxID=1912094 RepID=UPI00273504FE|nr:carbonic anhydrase family protein [Thalassospira sp.]MDP2699599.1 carbonic anhydrase family protein [Thalassospira sp.]